MPMPYAPSLQLIGPPDFIEIFDGSDAGVYIVPEGITHIGRSRRSDFRLADKTVSREQCYLVREGDEVRVYDCGSHNSTWLKFTEARGDVLADGDVIRIGRLELLFSDSPALQGTRNPQSVPSSIPAEIPSLDSGTEPTGSGVAAAGVDIRDAGTASSKGSSERHSRSSRPGARVDWVALCILGVLVASTLSFLLLLPRRAAPERNDESRVILNLRNQLAMVQARLGSKEASLEALEREIASTEWRQQGMPGAASVALERLLGEIATLEARELRLRDDSEMENSDLASAQAPELAGGPSPGPHVPGEIVWEVSGSLDLAELAESTPDSTAGMTANAPIETPSDAALVPASAAVPISSTDVDGGRAEVITRVENLPPPELALRAGKEVADLLEHLLEAIDNYALPSTTPRDLEPHLASLANSAGAAAYKGLLRAQHHASELLTGIDENVAFLEKRNRALLQKASRYRKSEGSSRKTYGSGESAEIEKLQRLLDLSERKIKIKRSQRERLEPLGDAVLNAIAGRRDLEAIVYFTRHFRGEKSTSERLAILEAIKAAGHDEAIPLLIPRLSISDLAMRRAVRKALVALSGEDLGGKQSEWESWWRKRQDPGAKIPAAKN